MSTIPWRIGTYALVISLNVSSEKFPVSTCGRKYEYKSFNVKQEMLAIWESNLMMNVVTDVTMIPEIRALRNHAA